MLKVGDIITLKNKEVSSAEHIIIGVSDGTICILMPSYAVATVDVIHRKVSLDEIESYVPRGESELRTFNLDLAEDINRPKITFDDLMDRVDGRSLQRVFREIDDRTLAGVLFSCKTKERVKKIKDNVSKNHFARLLDTIECGIGNTEYDVSIFVKIVRQLDEMGEIVIARDNEYNVDLEGSPVVETYSDGSVYEVPKPKSTFDVNKWFEEQQQLRKEREAKYIKDLADWKQSVGL
jgi:hypothetical protein